MSQQRISPAVFAKETVAGETLRCPLCRTYLLKEDEYGARLSEWSSATPGEANIVISWKCRHCHTDVDVGIMPDADWWEDYFDCGHPYQPYRVEDLNAVCREAMSTRAFLAITKIVDRFLEKRPFADLLVQDKILLEDLEDLVERLLRKKVDNAKV